MAHVIIAEIPVKAEFLEAAKAAVRNILADTRNEVGCDEFKLHCASDGSPKLFIYERWRDRAAFDHHHAQSYTRDVYSSYEQWLDGPVVLTELSDLD